MIDLALMQAARAVVEALINEQEFPGLAESDYMRLVEAIAAFGAAQRAAGAREERERLIRLIAKECRHIRSHDPLWQILGDPKP